MAYIRVIDEDEAEGKLFELYDSIQRTRGRVSNVLRIQSLDPKGLQAHLDLYLAHIFRPGGISRLEREMVAVVVSAANGCEYCVTHHSEALSKYAKDGDLGRQLAQDRSKADLSDQHRALVEFAVGLTTKPAEGREDAIQSLRSAGYDDEAILHITEIVSYFNYVNRMVSGLGVSLEAEDERDYSY